MDPDFDPLQDAPCERPGCPGIAYGAKASDEPTSAEEAMARFLCQACYELLPICARDGHIAPESCEEFCEDVRDLRANKEKHLIAGECDCGITFHWPMTSHPQFLEFRKWRRECPNSPLDDEENPLEI